MATKVHVIYTSSLNMSITKDGNGEILKVTQWTTGNPAKDTERTISPRLTNRRKK